MTHHIVLTDHRAAPGLIEADVPPDLNAAILRGFQAARIDADLHRYVFHQSLKAQFIKWAKHQHAFVQDKTSTAHVDADTDDRGTTEERYARECCAITGWVDASGDEVTEHSPGAIPLRCGHPVPWETGRKSRDPYVVSARYCPGCGAERTMGNIARVERDETHRAPRRECPSCHTRVTSRPKHCPGCGRELDQRRDGQTAGGARPRLAEPQSIGDAMFHGFGIPGLKTLHADPEWDAYRAYWTACQRAGVARASFSEWSFKGKPATPPGVEPTPIKDPGAGSAPVADAVPVEAASGRPSVERFSDPAPGSTTEPPEPVTEPAAPPEPEEEPPPPVTEPRPAAPARETAREPATTDPCPSCMRSLTRHVAAHDCNQPDAHPNVVPGGYGTREHAIRWHAENPDSVRWPRLTDEQARKAGWDPEPRLPDAVASKGDDVQVEELPEGAPAW